MVRTHQSPITKPADNDSNSSFHDIQPPANPTSVENRTCDDTSVKIPNENSVSRPPPKKKPIPWLIYIRASVLLVCFALVCGLISSLALPVLLVAYLVTRLLQFISHGNNYVKISVVFYCIKLLILYALLFLLVLAGILSAVVHFVPRLQHITFTGLSITKWIHLYCVSFGILAASMFIAFCFMYYIPLVPLDFRESGDDVGQGVIEISNCLLFWLGEFEVMRLVPTLKHHKFLGLYTRKWIEATLLVLIANNVISLSTHMIVWLLRRCFCEKFDKGKGVPSPKDSVNKLLNRHYVVYFAGGTKNSINFILGSLMLLQVWVLYFGSHLRGTAKAQYILKFGTWTCFSLFVCAFLWLFKTIVLLLWESQSVYSRLSSRITVAGKQMYFLDHIENCNNEKKIMGWKKQGKEILLHNVPTMYEIQQMSLCILSGRNDLSKETYSFDILENLKNSCQADDTGLNIEDYLRRVIEVGIKSNNDKAKEWKLFEDQLCEYVDSSKELSFEERLEIWTERACSNCLILANTLSSSEEVANCLNNIISWLIIAATFIMWLLLTGLASTKVLVLIASPLLAATFIFGETCKTMFQGIIFVYVVHPFVVGDLCIIDGILMEVKTVGIWKTTFSKISVQEEVIYSNSELSNKNCINYKTDFNWNDNVEFEATSLDKEKIQNIIQEIEEYLDRDKENFRPGSHYVEVLTTGDSIKIAVNFRHNVNIKINDYFECLKRKCKQRSKFAIDIQNLLNQSKYAGSKASEKSPINA